MITIPHDIVVYTCGNTKEQDYDMAPSLVACDDNDTVLRTLVYSKWRHVKRRPFFPHSPPFHVFQRYYSLFAYTVLIRVYHDPRATLFATQLDKLPFPKHVTRAVPKFLYKYCTWYIGSLEKLAAFLL